MITLSILMNSVIAPIQDVEIFTHSTGSLFIGRADNFNKSTGHAYDDYLVEAVYTCATDDFIYIAVR